MKPGFRLEDRYRMERRLGRRGPAQVWAARDELLARGVAVTLVSVRRSRRDLRRRLRDAARAAASVEHPGIATTYDYGEAEGDDRDALVYTVTEHLGGESLAARLARGRPPAWEAVSVCAQVAGALTAVHACGIAHGDLRAAQVFLTADGVKLLGLGLSGAVAGADDADEAEPEPEPEIDADGPPTEPIAPGQAADVRALGLLLAECLTGDPEAAPGPAAAAGAPADLVELVELAERCRAAEADERPPAAEAARVLALAAARLAPPTQVAAHSPAARGSRWRGLGRTRRALLLGGGAAAALALVLAPLAVILPSLPDAPRGVSLTPPSGTAAVPSSVPPSGSPDGSPSAAPSETATRSPAPPAPPSPMAVPAGTRAAAVDALARLRRAIDVGIAAGEVGARFGGEFATLVTTLLNEVDGGEPVDLGRRVARLRAALAGRAPGDVAPDRAARLTRLLAEVPAGP
ncbi:protein kinase domain-containing protein [Actinomadura chibensis]|uniref:non-specific serine/threonine protein kinase n=1 Tax=Actinomadura chibensis TaxID=392828 RepID=A0A5D0NAX3_9ACTN|nr:protein kinase [Actinomadura chibensis]TYB41477.1 protein kinase [Actinomadura chibensis]